MSICPMSPLSTVSLKWLIRTTYVAGGAYAATRLQDLGTDELREAMAVNFESIVPK